VRSPPLAAADGTMPAVVSECPWPGAREGADVDDG
jgi:hypothetical protein